jgi:hypothetical protein
VLLTLLLARNAGEMILRNISYIWMDYPLLCSEDRSIHLNGLSALMLRRQKYPWLNGLSALMLRRQKYPSEWTIRSYAQKTEVSIWMDYPLLCSEDRSIHLNGLSALMLRRQKYPCLRLWELKKLQNLVKLPKWNEIYAST